MNDFQSIQIVIRDLSQGSANAFRWICEHYKATVYKFAFGYVKCDYFAERIVEEVFAIIWNNKCEFEGHTPASFEFSILCFAKLSAFKIVN
jgi:DNA-directed RNA polymerase specialized sigma24 family protein